MILNLANRKLLLETSTLEKCNMLIKIIFFAYSFYDIFDSVKVYTSQFMLQNV